MVTKIDNSRSNQRKQGPSVILGEHGGVKTMIWTDSTTYWQSANKHRSNAPSQLPQVPPPQNMPPLSVDKPTQGLQPRTTSSPILKMERPPDREQALKMSSAVDGLLSLSSQGQQRPSPPASSTTTPPMASPMASPSPLPPLSAAHHVLHLSPAHLPHSSSPVAVSTPPMSMPPSVIPSPTASAAPASQQPPPPQPPRRRSPMNMERLWAGDMSQLPSHVIESQNGHMNLGGLRPGNPDQEDEEPLLCNICGSSPHS